VVGAAGSGKQRGLPLLSNIDALREPPGGPVWRRPLLAVVIGIAVIFAALFIVDAIRGHDPSFSISVRRAGRCPSVESPTDRCFTVDVTNTGHGPGAASCTWSGEAFRTAELGVGGTASRELVVSKDEPKPTVRCEPVDA
jgi:hypothetical protein